MDFNPVLIALVLPSIAFALAILVAMAWRDAAPKTPSDSRHPLGGDGI